MSHHARQGTNNSPESPINLREKFGQGYRVVYEESYYTDQKKNGTKAEAVALQIMPCKYGHIFPWGLDRLAASTDHKGKIANQLTKLDCCRVEQDGNDGVTVSYSPADFDKVAKFMKPSRRKKLTLERREAFIEAGRAHQFTESTGQTTVFRGQDASKGTKATSESPVRSGAKTGSEKTN